MSLATLLAAYDDAALVAVASKGLVIRAGKDVAAGKVSVTSSEDGGASLEVIGETVTLSGKTLDAARCSCAATGVCRHILAGVLHLRDQSDEMAPEVSDAPPASFDLAEIERFAGADWAYALALAEQAVAPEARGRSAGPEARGSVAVTFSDSDAQVTFPGGMGLRQALYKGSVAAHKRRAIAAAALAVAQKNGAVLPEAVTETRASAAADPEALTHIAQALEAAAIALAAGTFAQTQQQLFNLAVSTRAEAVPRLAAELRGIAKRLDGDRLRQALETPTDILGGIARCYALVEALRLAPRDPALVGRLARSYEASGPKTVAFLGGEIWETPGGAKGLTCVFCDLNTGMMHRATHARAAGTDLNFDPRQHWSTPLWGVARPPELAGRRLTLPDANCAPDGQLGLTQSAGFDGVLEYSDLPFIQNWADAAQAARTQKGQGLRRLPGDAYLLLGAADFGAVSFDAYAQVPVWDWLDAQGDVMPLRLPPDAPNLERDLAALTRRIKGGLVALPPGAAMGRLISVWVDGPEPGPFSLGLQSLPKPKGLGAMMDRFVERARPRDVSQIAPLDPLAMHFERASEAVLAGLLGQPGLPENLVKEAQALGLSHVLGAQAGWAETKHPSDALRLAYMLSIGRDLTNGDGG